MGYITTGADHSLGWAYRLVGVLVMGLRMMILAVRDTGQALQGLRVCHSPDFLYGGCRCIESQKPEDSLSVEATERRQGPTVRRRMATIATESGPPKRSLEAVSCGAGNCLHIQAIRWKEQLARDLWQSVVRQKQVKLMPAG